MSSVSAAPLDFSLTVTAVPAGNAYAVFGRPGSSGLVGGPAVNAIAGSSGWLNSVVAANDGTLFVADENNCAIIRITPAGGSSFLNTPQPGGSLCVSTGSDGQIASARLGRPFQLLLDGPRNRLFVSELDHTQSSMPASLIRVIDLASGIITHFAGGALGGGPGFGDGAAANLATLGTPPLMALAGDGQGLLVYAATIPRLRRISFTPPNVITTVFTPGGCAAASPPRPAGATTPLNTPGLYASFGIAALKYPAFVQDSSGFVWFSGDECSRGYALVRLELPSTVMAYGAQFLGSGAFTDGVSIRESVVEPGGVTLDDAGNLYVFKSNGTVWRINAVTGVLNVVAGNGQAGATAEYGPARMTRLGYAASVAFDGSGTLYVVGSSGSTPNMIWAIPGVGAAQPTTPTLSVTSGNMQSARVTEATPQPLVATLRDGLGQPIGGAQIEWTSAPATPGIGVQNITQLTSASGEVSQIARPGFLVQSYTLRPRLVTLRDATVASADFTTIATAPVAGSAVTLINTTRATQPNPLAMSGPFQFLNAIEAVAASPAGTISLVTTFGEFFQVSAAGAAQYVASISTITPTTTVSGVALDAPRNRLIYCVTRSDSSPSELRARDLTTHAETRIAGGGTLSVPGAGVGGSALLASLPPATCKTAIHPDGRLFVRFAAGPANTYVVDLGGTLQLSPLIPPVGNAANCATANGMLLTPSTTLMFRFDPVTGEAIYPYTICGTSYPPVSSQARIGFGRVNMSGGAVLIGPVPLVNGNPAEPTAFAVEDNEDILFVTQQDGRVARMSRTNGVVTVLMGDGTTAMTGPDFDAATTSALQFPTAITPLPGGRFLVRDQRSCRTAW